MLIDPDHLYVLFIYISPSLSFAYTLSLYLSIYLYISLSLSPTLSFFSDFKVKVETIRFLFASVNLIEQMFIVYNDQLKIHKDTEK